MIEFSVLISSLNTAMRITEQNLDALLTTQFLFIPTLHARLPDIVTRLVVVVLLDIRRRGLSHVAQHMSRHGILILSHATLLHIETRKAEHLLLKDTKVLVAKLTDKQLLSETRVTRITVTILHDGHPTIELFLCNAQRMTELRRINPVLCLVHHHHNVIGWLVIHQQFPMAVSDITA